MNWNKNGDRHAHPSAVELLDIWEADRALTPAEQALALLSAADPGTAVEELSRLPIGRRDRRLLNLRESLFGAQFDGTAVCPNCGEKLAFTFEAPQFFDNTSVEIPEEQVLNSNGFQVRYRLADSRDLAAVAGADEAEAYERLLARCVLQVMESGQELSPDALSPELLHVVTEAMAEQDPLAEVQIDLTCPACEHRWPALFDIAAYFWQEIDAWARRTLYEVAALARAYGWHEADILAMSAWRRQFYLGQVSG